MSTRTKHGFNIVPCFFPRLVFFERLPNGKRFVHFSQESSRGCEGESGYLSCGQCMGCRLKASREWGLRCHHEAKMHEDNCFLTLTFDDQHLFKMCPNGSLDRSHIPDFMRRLRKKLGVKVRYFGCGEYGPKFGRPHYHVCLFGFDFPDKKRFRKRGEFDYFTSEILDSLWPYGHSVIGTLTFESSAYVARYCTKKVTGKKAKGHYCGRVPEFSAMSNRPGIGHSWFKEYCHSDVIPHDSCILRGKECSVPRFYDKHWQAMEPDSFAAAKDVRREKAKVLQEDNSPDRLESKLKCCEARLKKLVRYLENLE